MSTQQGQIDPAVLDQGAATLKGMTKGLKVKALDAKTLRSVKAGTLPQVNRLAVSNIRALRKGGAPGCPVTADRLQGLLDQRGALPGPRQAVGQILIGAQDMQIAIAAAFRHWKLRIDAAVQKALAGLDAAGRAKLAMDFAPIAQELERQQARLQKAVAGTKGQNQASAAEKAEAQAEAHLLSVMADIRENRPVDPQDLASASATYQKLVAADTGKADMANRRLRAR